jgi:hypothetical protein
MSHGFVGDRWHSGLSILLNKNVSIGLQPSILKAVTREMGLWPLWTTWEVAGRFQLGTDSPVFCDVLLTDRPVYNKSYFGPFPEDASGILLIKFSFFMLLCSTSLCCCVVTSVIGPNGCAHNRLLNVQPPALTGFLLLVILKNRNLLGYSIV